MKQDPTIPVYLITGFLDSGKTNFLKYTMQEPYFNDGSKSLVILCEEGEEEFDEKMLKKCKAKLAVVDDEETLTPAYLQSLQDTFKPDRVLIEYNGLWDIPKMLQKQLPKYWTYYQVITILDGENFRLYLNNIKMTAMSLVTNTDMVIFNRCAPDTDLVFLKRTVRSVNPKCELVFENMKGEEVECPEPDLPYSVDGPEIAISDENFGTFYIDLSAHPERYINKKISFLMQVMLNKKFPKNMFIGGRRAMTCCEADIRFLPYIFIYEKAYTLTPACWANLKATMKWEYHEGYQEEGPVFYVDEFKLANKPAEELITF